MSNLCIRGKPSADFTLEAEPERTLHAKLGQARKARLATSEVEISDSEQEKKIKVFEDSDTKFDKEREDQIMAEPQERLLRDYGGENAPLGRLTIVNQPVNIPKFQFHTTTIHQLEKRPFTRKTNEDANKHM